jgi:hypothetical protein
MKRLLMLAAVGLLVTGCASPNVNPSHPRARTGYVDFYADSSGELSWGVSRFEDRSQTFKTVFSELEPPPGQALRLAFPPGHYRLRVTFLNRAAREAGPVEVEVKDGMSTPVHVTLTPVGTAQVQTKDKRIGGTYLGRYGRSTKYGSDESTLYQVSAEAYAPRP